MKVIYDNQPTVLEAVGNGSHRYHYDIREVEVASSTDGDGYKNATNSQQYECQEVVVWEPLTSNRITEAVIAEKWDDNREQKFINEYNAVQLGIITDKDEVKARTQAYKDFLTERLRLKTMVDNDCKLLGIE